MEIEPAGGVTVDMSSSGIAFETPHDYSPGEEITMRVVVGRTGGKPGLEFACRGRVIRVDRGERGNRVAATVEWEQEEEGDGGFPAVM